MDNSTKTLSEIFLNIEAAKREYPNSVCSEMTEEVRKPPPTGNDIMNVLKDVPTISINKELQATHALLINIGQTKLHPSAETRFYHLSEKPKYKKSTQTFSCSLVRYADMLYSIYFPFPLKTLYFYILHPNPQQISPNYAFLQRDGIVTFDIPIPINFFMYSCLQIRFQFDDDSMKLIGGNVDQNIGNTIATPRFQFGILSSNVRDQICKLGCGYLYSMIPFLPPVKYFGAACLNPSKQYSLHTNLPPSSKIVCLNNDNIMVVDDMKGLREVSMDGLITREFPGLFFGVKMSQSGKPYAWGSKNDGLNIISCITIFGEYNEEINYMIKPQRYYRRDYAIDRNNNIIMISGDKNPVYVYDTKTEKLSNMETHGWVPNDEPSLIDVDSNGNMIIVETFHVIILNDVGKKVGGFDCIHEERSFHPHAMVVDGAGHIIMVATSPATGPMLEIRSQRGDVLYHVDCAMKIAYVTLDRKGNILLLYTNGVIEVWGSDEVSFD